MRNLNRNRPTIGVLAGWQAYTGTLHSFLDYVYRGISSAAQNLDCNLMIGCGVSAPFSSEGSTALPVLHKGVDFVPVGQWNCDGLLVVPPFLAVGIEQFLAMVPENYPVVFTGDYAKGPSVIVDNESGVEQAVSHLVEQHGHHHIGFIAGHFPPVGDSGARLRGYLSGLARHGIPYDPDLMAFGLHNPETSYHAVKEILSRGKPITALIASNDESAVGVLDALRDSGLVVPQDVAVIGFDDRFEARAQVPLLTTVHFPMFELGYKAVELLHKIIYEAAPTNSVVRIATQLIMRESCGCLPGARRLSSPVEESRKEPFLPAQRQYSFQRSSKNRTGYQEQISPLQAVDTKKIVAAMVEPIYKEMLQMSQREVEYLCMRLLDSFITSMKNGEATTFRQAIQQILDHVAMVGDDPYAWQNAVTELRDWTPALLESLPFTLPSEQIEYMLHQARIAISEVLRGQYSRMLVNRAQVVDQVGQMTSQFFSVRTEAEVFNILSSSLKKMGFRHVVAAYYESQAENPLYWSNLKAPADTARCLDRFPTTEFPPHGLFPDDHSFQVAVLPMVEEKGMLGFVAFSIEKMEPLGTITRQLIAALRGARLFQDALIAQHTAEIAQRTAEDAQRMAEEANEMKSRFLSVVSHELRTPLNLISGLSNMILSECKSGDEHTLSVDRVDLERIYYGAQHLEGLIRDVLDLARSDIGQLTINREPLNMREVLDAVVVIGEQLASDKDLEWKVEIPPVLPMVSGDRTRLRQVILNLINNSVKFTSQGRVVLSAQADSRQLTITVQDTGLGIPVEEQDIIFDEFRQSKRTTARGYGGLGLGLAICKRLVEEHHGTIDVWSSGEEGFGSTFSIKLPVIEQMPLSEPRPAPNQLVERVLLLVKDAAGGDQLSRHLTRQGFLVETHQAGDHCNWMAWLQPTPPDKIILDLGFTLDFGWEILKTLKENPATRGTPVLFYNLGKTSDQEEIGGSLLDLDFLTKPLNPTELADELFSRGLVEEKANNSAEQSILIVDDDPAILELHTRILNMLASGYRIIQARNGVEAIRLVREERPCLVLLDLMMPEMDGFTVLEIMQSEHLTRGISVIVLTGQVLTEEDMARLNCGVAAVLSKGMYSHHEMLEQVTATLTRKRRKGTESQRMVLKAMSYIHANYKEPISRSDIANFVGVSERHLARCFQQEVGLSPIIYLNRFRVRAAKELLDARKYNITEVAMEVGFSTGAYFARVFREEVGQSPREYMRDLVE